MRPEPNGTTTSDTKCRAEPPVSAERDEEFGSPPLPLADLEEHGFTAPAIRHTPQFAQSAFRPDSLDAAAAGQSSVVPIRCVLKRPASRSGTICSMGRVSPSAVSAADPDRICIARHCTCHPPAMGHVFQAGTLICECGRGWFSHQRDPMPCPSAVRRAAAGQPNASVM